jgi:putative membrane protein
MGTSIYAAAVLGLAAPSLAPAAAQEPGSLKTREFVQAAAQSDQFEISEGQTAVTQTKDPAIRAFAQRMTQEHQGMRSALEQAAARAGLQPPPMAMSADQAQMLSALQSQTGAQFDQTYLHQQTLAHRSALVTVQAYAAGGDSPELRRTASSDATVIRGHLAMAEELSARLGGF